jgi:hypothetical protein
MITLRSKFAGYRLREHQFANGVCRVTEEQFERLKNDPEYGKDFWREDEKAIANIVAENPIVEQPNAAGGESASANGEASKTPMTAAEKKAADKAAKEAAKGNGKT